MTDAEFISLKEQGAKPHEVYAQARQGGSQKIEAVKLLRSHYGFSLQEAMSVAWEVDGYPNTVLPPIRSYDLLHEYLRTNLGYCSCAYDALPALRDLLGLAQGRTDAAMDAAEFSRLSRQIETILNPPFGAAFAAWTVFALEQQGLVWHGFRLSDLWINPKGRDLLQALKNFAEPEAVRQEDVEAG